MADIIAPGVNAGSFSTLEGKSTCPCCSNALLRHVSSKGVYWRCSYCYQEMPF